MNSMQNKGTKQSQEYKDYLNRLRNEVYFLYFLGGINMQGIVITLIICVTILVIYFGGKNK